jgi:hypothetical protein
MELDNNIMISENNISGPCLPWCFTHNRTTYIMIGIFIGLIGYHMFLNYTKNKKTKK